MIILPAIDLKGGKCVRLRQGLADQQTIYDDDPVHMARRWAAAGATFLHVVDLDGAFAGRPIHTAVIREIVAAVGRPVEVGGGLRTDAAIEEVLNCGVYRAVIGTRALEDEARLGALAARFGCRLAVGIDARDGLVQVKGWVETSACRAVDLAARADAAGVRTIIYTDTATDGMLQGPNLAAMRDMCAAVRCDVVASGGISAATHVQALRALGARNLVGAIVGKALYDGIVNLAELRQAAGEV